MTTKRASNTETRMPPHLNNRPDAEGLIVGAPKPIKSQNFEGSWTVEAIDFSFDTTTVCRSDCGVHKVLVIGAVDAE